MKPFIHARNSVKRYGGVRKTIIPKKIEINKTANIDCLYIPYKEIYLVKNKCLQDLINQREKYAKYYSPT